VEEAEASEAVSAVEDSLAEEAAEVGSFLKKIYNVLLVRFRSRQKSIFKN